MGLNCANRVDCFLFSPSSPPSPPPDGRGQSQVSRGGLPVELLGSRAKLPSGEMTPWWGGMMNEQHQGVYTACCCLPCGSRHRREGRAREEEGGACGVAQNLLSGATTVNILLFETLVPRGGTAGANCRLDQPVTCQPPPASTPAPLP